VHFESEVQEEQRRHDTETKCDPPNRIEVVQSKDPEADEADKVGEYESEVDHRVGG